MTAPEIEYVYEKHILERFTFLVPSLVIRGTEQNIITDRFVLNPALLRSVRNATRTRKIRPCVQREAYTVHFAEQGHKQARLARSCRPHNEVDSATPKSELSRYV